MEPSSSSVLGVLSVSQQEVEIRIDTPGPSNIHDLRFLIHLTYVVIGMNLPQPTTRRVRSETERDIGGVNKALSSGIEHHA